MTASLGPLRVGNGWAELSGAGGHSARFGPGGAELEHDGCSVERIDKDELGAINGVSLPTRGVAAGRTLVLLGWLVPAGTANSEPTTLQINFGVLKWGWERFQTWDLGRPTMAPFPKHVARQVEMWMGGASQIGLEVLVDPVRFASFVEAAGRSWRRRDLLRAFTHAVGQTPDW